MVGQSTEIPSPKPVMKDILLVPSVMHVVNLRRMAEGLASEGKRLTAEAVACLADARELEAIQDLDRLRPGWDDAIRVLDRPRGNGRVHEGG